MQLNEIFNLPKFLLNKFQSLDPALVSSWSGFGHRTPWWTSSIRSWSIGSWIRSRQILSNWRWSGNRHQMSLVRTFFRWDNSGLFLFIFVIFNDNLQKNCTLQPDSNSDRRSKARSLTIWPPPPPRSQTLVRNLSQLKKWWQCPVTFSFFRHSYKKLLGLKGQNWRMAVF